MWSVLFSQGVWSIPVDVVVGPNDGISYKSGEGSKVIFLFNLSVAFFASRVFIFVNYSNWGISQIAGNSVVTKNIEIMVQQMTQWYNIIYLEWTVAIWSLSLLEIWSKFALWANRLGNYIAYKRFAVPVLLCSLQCSLPWDLILNDLFK